MPKAPIPALLDFDKIFEFNYNVSDIGMGLSNCFR